MMKEQIIACVDGSPSTMAICHWGAWVASKLQAPLKLLHTLETPQTSPQDDWSGSIGLDSREELLAELVALDQQRNRIAQEQSKLLLQAAKQTVLESLGHNAVPPIKSCQRHGTLLESLCELEPETRLVILGRQGEQSSQQHGQVGSQLESVVRVLHTPVLMALPEFKAPSKVMFAYDGSVTGRNALKRLSISPLLQGIPCHLVMVGGEAEQLAEAQTVLQQAGIEVQTYALAGEVEAKLKEHICQEQLDLVIMGAYGHSRLRQFFLGSHTSRMLSQSPVPLLLLR